MFKIALGHSEDPDTQDAVIEVIAQCRATLGDSQAQAGIVFSSIEYEYSLVLQEIKKNFPNIQLIGCTSGGELSSHLGYTESSLILITFASDTISMATTIARDMSKGIETSVTNALAEVKNKLAGEPTLCLIFPDCFTSGIVGLVQQLQKNLGKTFPIFGGGASDPRKYDQTHEFYDQSIMQDSASMLFFSGPLDYAFNVVSGWEPFTSKTQLMQSKNNVAYTIGEKSALDFYKHYLNGPPTISHPLAVFEEGQKRFYLRVPLSTEEETGSIVFGGDLPSQALMSICHADSEKLLEETQNLIRQIKPQIESPCFVFIFSCSCRQSILGTKTKQEYLNLKAELPPDTPIVGFYAYGQVSPFDNESGAFVHNDSIVALVLKEKNE